MSEVKNTESNALFKKDYTALIIVGILVFSTVLLTLYIFNRNRNVESSKMLETALEKIQEFDRLENIYSKQEMEKEVVGLLDRVIGKYPGTPSGKRALFYKGYVLFYTENYDKAINNFKYFIDNNKRNYLLPKAYYFLSYCYSGDNKDDEAISVLEEFNKKYKNSYYSPLILYRIATLYELKKDKEKAISYYNKLLDEYPLSSQKMMAKKKKLLLENNIEL